MRGNFNLTTNFGNQRQNFSKSTQEVTTRSTQDEGIIRDLKQKKKIKVETKMPTEKNDMIHRNVENTAYSRWNKVFQKN